MAFQRVLCEVYFLINITEIYSELRHVDDYPGKEFESREDADRFLAEEGYTRHEAGGSSWRKAQAYRHAWVSRHLREVKE